MRNRKLAIMALNELIAVAGKMPPPNDTQVFQALETLHNQVCPTEYEPDCVCCRSLKFAFANAESWED